MAQAALQSQQFPLRDSNMTRLFRGLQPRTMERGDFVIYHDSNGEAHHGLITQVWSPVMINVLFLGDGDQTQTVRDCHHKSIITAQSNYWRFPDEPANPRGCAVRSEAISK